VSSGYYKNAVVPPKPASLMDARDKSTELRELTEGEWNTWNWNNYDCTPCPLGFCRHGEGVLNVCCDKNKELFRITPDGTVVLVLGRLER
jgi:hypothetical protein